MSNELHEAVRSVIKELETSAIEGRDWVDQEGYAHFVLPLVAKLRVAIARETQCRKRTGKEVNVNGYIDAKGIEYLGVAHEMEDGTWQCLANVHGSLCLVEVTLTAIHEEEHGGVDGA